jgi:AcrR family transcriptional regulator
MFRAPLLHAFDGVSTADRLLASTEKLLLEGGAASLSIRKIGAEAGFNAAMVSYHFDGLQFLLGELLSGNVRIIHEDRARRLAAAVLERTKARRIDALIAAYVEPIWLTPSKWSRAPARAVVRELLPLVEPSLRQRTVTGINESVDSIAKALLPLFMRLRLLSGSTEMLQPRLDELGLYPIDRKLSKARQERLQVELLRFAKGALLAP